MTQSYGAGRPPALRWAQTNVDGVLLDRPGRIYCARLVATLTGSAAVTAVLRDGPDVFGPPVLALHTGGTIPDDWPPVPVSAPFLRGLFVEFGGGTQTARLLLVGWETD